MSDPDLWFRTLLEPWVRATWETDARGVVRSDSPSWRSYTGQTREQWQLEGWTGAVHPDERERARQQWREAIAEGKRVDTEYRLQHGEGWQWSLVRAAPLRRHDGAIERWLGLAIDIAERKRSEEARRDGERREAREAIRVSEGRLRAIVRSATDFAIVTLSPDRTVTSWSPGAELVFGYPSAEILGRSSDVLFTPEDRAAGVPQQEADRARREGRAEDERWHMRKDGSRFYASGVITPLEPEGFVKVARDLTDRKAMEDALREARDRLADKVRERTAALEAEIEQHIRTESERVMLLRQLITAEEDERRRLARDLHDQTGQMFAGLSLAIHAVTEGDTLPPRVAEKLTRVQRMTDELGRQMHELAVRVRPPALDDLGLLAALNELVRQWSADTGVTVDVHTVGLDEGRLSSEVETVLYRVVQEALTNVAKHAQARQVSITITVSHPEGTTTAVIEDDGRGFDVATVGRGRLGLAGMRERVALVGGQLEIESGTSGTTILVNLPVRPASRRS